MRFSSFHIANWVGVNVAVCPLQFHKLHYKFVAFSVCECARALSARSTAKLIRADKSRNRTLGGDDIINFDFQHIFRDLARHSTLLSLSHSIQESELPMVAFTFADSEASVNRAHRRRGGERV